MKAAPRVPMYPRDGPGSMEFVGGTGDITAMVSCGDFLEAYRVDRTFRAESPETVDPGRTNPNAPWVTKQVAEIGSGHPVVARIFIQSHQMVRNNLALPAAEVDALTLHMHACKEALLTCEAIAHSVAAKISDTLEGLKKDGVQVNKGRSVTLPQIAGLEIECANFLVHAKRMIKLISELPSFFLRLKRSHSNFSGLGKDLAGLLKPGHHITRLVVDHVPHTKHLIDLRNFHEHPKAIRTVIRDFHVLPDGNVSAPTWQVVGGTETHPGFVQQEMLGAVGLLFELCELLFIHLVDHRLVKHPAFRVQIEQVPNEEVDLNLPIRFVLRHYLVHPPREMAEEQPLTPNASPISNAKAL